MGRVGWAGGTERALAMARDADIDAALLDVNLSGQDTFAVADILSERHIPFVFATGYGADGVADRFRGVPTLTKPFQCDELDRALHRATAGVRSSVGGQFADPGSRASPGANSPGRSIVVQAGRATD